MLRRTPYGLGLALTVVGALAFLGCAARGCGTKSGEQRAGTARKAASVTLKRTWDWAGIVGTGQSLSVGANGTPVLSKRQPFQNLKLSLGWATVPPFDPSRGGYAMVPLVEPIRTLAWGYPGPYPGNIYGETPHTAMANQITALARDAGGDYVTAHSVVGESGQPMSVIGKGAADTGETGRAYAATLFEVAVIAKLAREAGKTYGVGAVVLTHGESDAGNATYEGELVRLWTDYNRDLKAITGQALAIPLLVSQQHSVPDPVGSRSASTLAEWHAGVAHPGDIVCSGPKYQYAYDHDHTHLVALGYQALGEKVGQVYFKKVVLGHDWQPLQPIGFTRNGRVISVRFHVPVPPLTWDSALPLPHQTAFTEWAKGRGFEVRSEAGRLAIDSVAIQGDAVAITCEADLPASGVVVGYAMTSDGVPMPGGTRRWGTLRDSDPFVGSTTSRAQPNYAVAFELPVP